MTAEDAARIVGMIRELAGEAASITIDSLAEFGVDVGVVTIKIYTEEPSDEYGVLSETE